MTAQSPMLLFTTSSYAYLEPAFLAAGRFEKGAIERKTFRGKITFVNPEIQPIAETAVLIRAEFENPNFELRPGFKVAATIFLNDDVASRIPQPNPR